MVGTVITVKELYGIKSADIQFRNGTNSTPLITLEENRKYIVPYFQREIRWTKDNLITLINDVKKGSKKVEVLANPDKNIKGYSEKVIQLVSDKLKLPDPKEFDSEEEAKGELDRYFQMNFRNQYAQFASSVIEMISKGE